jgi:NitT/TauT family transport system permease protein
MGMIVTALATSRRFAGLWPRPAARLRFYQVAFALFVFGFWQYASGHLIDSFWVSSPTAVAAFLWDGFSSGYLLGHCLVTFGEAGLGFAIGAGAGILTGLVLAVAETPRRILDPYFMAIYGMPRIALAPLFIIWFGFGFAPKLLLVFLLSFFPIVVSSLAGFKSADRDVMDFARTTGASDWRLFFRIQLPQALPHIFTGLKVGAALAATAAVVAEFVASDKGLGYLLLQYNGNIDTPMVFATIVLLSLLGLAVYYVVEIIERIAIPWHVSQQQTAAEATM